MNSFFSGNYPLLSAYHKQFSIAILLLLVLKLSLMFPSFSHADTPTALGKKLFSHFCVQCHGEEAKGDGINSESLNPYPRDLTDSKGKHMVNLSNSDIINAITKGGAGVDKSPNMPPWGKTLSEYEIAAIASFVRTLHPNKAEPIDFSNLNQKRPETKLAEVELDLSFSEVDIKIGRNYYTKYGCNGCHEINLHGGKSGPALDNISSKMKPQEMLMVIKNPGGIKKDSKMPTFGLNDKIIANIVQFLTSLRN